MAQDREAYNAWQSQIYGSGEAPVLSTDMRKLEELAKAKISSEAYNYVFGSAGQARTCLFNVQAFDRYRIRPSMLVPANDRDTSVELFGTRHPSPVLLGPIGVQGICHKDGEEASARAAAAANVPFVMSTAATRSIEQVAEASGDGHRWYQLYWPKSEEVLASVLNRAKQAGFSALVVTLDTIVLGFRPLDLDRSYLPFLKGHGNQVGFSDPVFMEANGATEYLGKLPGDIPSETLFGLSAAYLGEFNSGYFRSWQELDLIKKYWKGPIVLKGIQTVEDARHAIDAKVDAIIVSNHGGRQVDGAIASLDALAAIGKDERIKKSGLPILFDSGLRSGADIFKALALGAKAVLIGRPYIYGLTLAGEEGVEHVIRSLLAEFEITMALSGRRTVADIDRSAIDDTLAARL